NLNGLAEYYRCIGFENTYCYQMTSSFHVASRIREIHRQCPGAKFVLLGFSAGANCVRAMANSFCDEGIFIDRLIYLGGDTLTDCQRSRPCCVGQVINIMGNGYLFSGHNLFFKGEDICGAVNVRLDVWHITLPKQDVTQQMV